VRDYLNAMPYDLGQSLWPTHKIDNKLVIVVHSFGEIIEWIFYIWRDP
jgi:hypothetical protein